MANTQDERRSSRARIVLGIIIVILVLLLVGLGVFFVKVLTPAGVLTAEGDETGQVEWIRSMYGFGPSEEEQLKGPTSVAIAPNGDVYVTDPQWARIMVFSPDGAFSRLVHTGAGGVQEGMFLRPESIDVDENGDLYVADSYAGKIVVFDQDGNYLREWSLTEEPARGVYVRDGNVYVLAVGVLRVFDTEGNELGSFGTRGRGPGQIDAYQGVYADADRIYIGDALNHRVQALSNTGEALWIAPENEEDAESSDAPYDLPTDLTMDAAGRLVVADSFKFAIVVSDPENGEFGAMYGREGEGEGQFWYPTSIDYDAERDWFAVADTGNNRVQIIRLPGSGGGAAATLRRALSSPYRYCAVPLALLLLGMFAAVIVSRRSRRRRQIAEPQVEQASGI